MWRRIKRGMRFFRPAAYARPKWEAIEVAPRQCVSYHGFRYERESGHPLERYARDLVEERPLREARAAFIEWLRFYRPENASQAMNCQSLDPRFPMWVYPWDAVGGEAFVRRRAWRDSPDECPDILTHFCDAGIPSYRIEEEWMWAERALDSLRRHGYQPRKRGFLRVQRLVRRTGEAVHLTLDGNHRLAALSALNTERVWVLHDAKREVREDACETWFGVRSGLWDANSALRVFGAFFERPAPARTAQEPAPILAPAGWKELYL